MNKANQLDNNISKNNIIKRIVKRPRVEKDDIQIMYNYDIQGVECGFTKYLHCMVKHPKCYFALSSDDELKWKSNGDQDSKNGVLTATYTWNSQNTIRTFEMTEEIADKIILAHFEYCLIK